MQKKTGRLLVVDDFEVNRDVLYRYLSIEGYTVFLAAGGQEAIDMLEKDAYDIVLLDILMPKVSGFDVLKYMKSSKKLHNIPVIVISALDQMETITQAIELGAEDYLTKPFNINVLKARIASSLEKKALMEREHANGSALEEEKQKLENMQKMLFPSFILSELKQTNNVVTRQYQNVFILFCELAGFSQFLKENSPDEAGQALQAMAEIVDKCALKHKIEIMRFFSSCMMCADGFEPPSDPQNILDMAVEIIDAVRNLPKKWEARVCVHSGPVIGGIINKVRPSFELWGNAINDTFILLPLCPPSKIVVTEEVCQKISPSMQATKIAEKGHREFIATDLFEISYSRSSSFTAH